MDIILASGSPRRKEILELGGYKYEVLVSNIEEVMDEEDPAALVMSLSKQKANAVYETVKGRKNAVIIGADTVVACDGKILGKPHSKDEAREMIGLLSGREHQVFTGMTFINAESGKSISFNEKSLVRVVNLSDEDTEEYISLKEPYDKAGGYAIQGAFAKYISGIEGDYYNIMGFPLCRFASELKKFENN